MDTANRCFRSQSTGIGHLMKLCCLFVCSLYFKYSFCVQHSEPCVNKESPRTKYRVIVQKSEAKCTQFYRPFLLTTIRSVRTMLTRLHTILMQSNSSISNIQVTLGIFIPLMRRVESPSTKPCDKRKRDQVDTKKG